jgi:hypothetical protein
MARRKSLGGGAMRPITIFRLGRFFAGLGELTTRKNLIRTCKIAIKVYTLFKRR